MVSPRLLSRVIYRAVISTLRLRKGLRNEVCIIILITRGSDDRLDIPKRSGPFLIRKISFLVTRYLSYVSIMLILRRPYSFE